MNAPAAPAAATLTFDEAHSAFLNSHPSDALNKPNDDVYRFDLSSDPTQNVAVRFSAQGGTLGITVNGEPNVRACLAQVREGDRLERQEGTGYGE